MFEVKNEADGNRKVSTRMLISTKSWIKDRRENRGVCSFSKGMLEADNDYLYMMRIVDTVMSNERCACGSTPVLIQLIGLIMQRLIWSYKKNYLIREQNIDIVTFEED